MKNIFLLFLVLTGLSTLAQDVSNLNAKIPVNKDVKIGKLDNGLTYYIRKNAKPENKVELRLVVNAGSILETDKQRGLAHFMEHMNFNGTKNFQHNELVDYLQSIGVKFGQHLNAYTSFDETVYILPIPSDDKEKLEKGFDILEDWAFNNLLTPEEIDKERGVVLEELRLGLGADKRMMDRYLPKLMYNSHYAERLPIGSKKVLETFDHKELKDFYKSWYRPNLMAVVVVGDIDVANIEAKIKDHFSGYKNPENEKERKEYKIPDHNKTLVAIESDPEASFTQVQLVYNDKGDAKPYTTIGDYRKYIVEELFGTMINERLQEIANNPNPPYTYAYAYHGEGWSRNKAAYQCFSMTDPKNQLRALEVLVEENERVKRHGFIQAELDRAKKTLLANRESSVKNKDKRQSRRLTFELINNFLTDEFIPGIEWEYKAAKQLMETISLDDVNGLINDFIHDGNRTVVFTSPEGEDYPKYTEQQVLDVLNKVGEKDVKPYAEEAVAESIMKEMPNAGSISSTEKLEKVDITKLKLSNGATVYYKKTDFNDNQILLRAFSPGGASLIESDEEYNNIKLALDGLTEAGLNGFSQNEMTKIQAGKEVNVSPFISDNYEGFWGQTVNKDLEDMFQMIHLYFTALNKNEEAYNSYVDKRAGYFGNLMNTPKYWYMNEFAKKREQNNPRFTNQIPTEEELRNQDYEKAYEFYQDRFKDAGDFKFFFVGSLDEKLVEKYAEIYLASLPSSGREESFVKRPFEHLKGKQEFVFNKGKDPKSNVQIQYRTEAPYDGKEAYYLKCAGEILSIKLVENLRESESGVYGVSAYGYASKYPVSSYNFVITFPCGPENVDKLKKAALEELQKLIDNGPTEKDLKKIKEAQRLELKENLKKNRYWSQKFFTLMYNEESLDKIIKAEEHIDNLTAKNVQDAMNKFIGDDVVIGILMPEE